MNSEKKKRETNSKFLSFVLRHHPEKIGLTLDGEGWASVDALVELANVAGHGVDRAAIEEIVATSDKQRFALSETENGFERIRVTPWTFPWDWPRPCRQIFFITGLRAAF